jgi:dolichyl-phosphate beta-glucosyltransferase
MDQSTPIHELDNLLPWYSQGFDVVIGSRGTSREGFSVLRQVGSLVFRALRGAFLLRHIRDTQCGFKLFKRRPLLDLFPKLQVFREEAPSGWKVTAYDVELLYLFERAGYSIQEVEVEWENRDESDTKGHSGELVRYMRESVSMAKQVLRVNVNRIRGLYDDVERARE